MPHISACIGSIDVALASMAKWPTSCTRAIQALSSSRLRTVRYLLRSIGVLRAEAARKTPIDRSKYRTVLSLEELNAWIARVHDVGHVAIDAKATSIDPMQAEMCGIALALGPNDAYYVPLSHKQSGDGAGLFAAGLCLLYTSPSPR